MSEHRHICRALTWLTDARDGACPTTRTQHSSSTSGDEHVPAAIRSHAGKLPGAATRRRCSALRTSAGSSAFRADACRSRPAHGSLSIRVVDVGAEPGLPSMAGGPHKPRPRRHAPRRPRRFAVDAAAGCLAVGEDGRLAELAVFMRVGCLKSADSVVSPEAGRAATWPDARGPPGRDPRSARPARRVRTGDDRGEPPAAKHLGACTLQVASGIMLITIARNPRQTWHAAAQRRSGA